MELWVSKQAFELALSMLLGAGLGVLYDVLRAVRAAFGRRALPTAVLDLVFCLLLAASLFFFNLFFLSGMLRWYVFVGCGGGGMLYFLTLSRLFRAAADRLRAAAARLFRRFFPKKDHAPVSNFVISGRRATRFKVK